MEAILEHISQQQKENWNKFSSGWKKWNDLSMSFLKPVGDEIIRLIQPKSNDYILDIASGTGEPGLTIARLLTNGKIVLTDLSEGMLEIAIENAAKQGIKNADTKVCDVSSLPFADNTFDSVSCRFGYMFFPDMTLATKELYRVLKPGGRIATSVWNVPEKNFWLTAIMDSIKANIDLSPLPQGAPGIFRCAQKDLMKKLFLVSGFKNILETETNTRLNTGTFDTYWNYMTEVAAPIVASLNGATDNQKANIKCDAYRLIKKSNHGFKYSFEGNARIIYGQK